jgi:predicted O-methyltransferase YrrM
MTKVPNGLPFDDSHYAATLPRKLWRALQLGPKYYLWALPRYLAHRRQRGLSLWDPRALTNPLREFRARSPSPDLLPPHYDEALAQFAETGLRLAMTRERLGNILRVWWEVRSVAGDVIECGAYQGATSLLIALLGKLNNIAQKVFMLDTFTGMPTGCAFDSGRREGDFRPATNQVERIQQQAMTLGVAERIEVHQGLFADTLPALAARQLRFALAHIDANIYQGTLDACRFAIPQVAPGGAVIFDDYNGVCDLGARLAIDEYFAGRSIKPLPLTASSAFVRL